MLGFFLLLCGGFVCYYMGVVFVIPWGLCLLLCWVCVCYFVGVVSYCVGFIRDCLICGGLAFFVSYFAVSALCLKCTEHVGIYSSVVQ